MTKADVISIIAANGVIHKVEEKRRLSKEYLVEYGALLDVTTNIKAQFDDEMKILSYDSVAHRQKMIEYAYIIRILEKLTSEIKCFLVDCNASLT